MKTEQQIIDRIADIQADDWMGTQTNDLTKYLPFESAKKYLKKDATETIWIEHQKYRLPPLDTIKYYLPFAWGKANDCRGLPASRSLEHMEAWLWLAGYDNIVEKCFSDYEHYGKFQLVICSELVGFDWRSVDSGEWVNVEDGPSISKTRIEELAEKAKQIAQQAKVTP